MSKRAVVWTIADSRSDGAQADLRAFEAFGVGGRAVFAEQGLETQLAVVAGDGQPAAIKIGPLASPANVEVMTRWIDRLREANPAVAVVMDVLHTALGEDLCRAYREQLFPRATLVIVNGTEAAVFAGVPPLASTAHVEQAARMLRESGANAVLVTGGDAAHDYVDAPWASGWLRSSHPLGTGGIFAAAAAAALALGFVEIEAAVLAKMAATHAMNGGDLMAQAFAHRMENLPEFVASPTETRVPFASLRDPALGLYAIVDSADWIERVLDAGVKTVQLRIKDPAHPRLREEIRRAVAASERAGAQLFINDHWRLAIEEGAYGVHLGQEDVGVANLDAIASAGLRLGISTHAYWEVCRAWSLRPSYIACGPIHATASKDMPWLSQGNGNLAYWCSLLPVPVVAIAGMDLARARQAWECGASGVAVMSGITAAKQPESVIGAFLACSGTRACAPDGVSMAGPTLRRTGSKPRL